MRTLLQLCKKVAWSCFHISGSKEGFEQMAKGENPFRTFAFWVCPTRKSDIANVQIILHLTSPFLLFVQRITGVK